MSQSEEELKQHVKMLHALPTKCKKCEVLKQKLGIMKEKVALLDEAKENF